MGEFELHFSVFGARAQELLGWYQDYLEKKLQGVSRAGSVIQYPPGFDHHSIGTYELNDRDRLKQSEIRGSVEWLLNQEPNKLYQFIVEKGLIDTLQRAISERNHFLEPIIMQQVKEEPGRAAFPDMPTEERAEYSLNRELQDWLNQKESEVTPADQTGEPGADEQGGKQGKYVPTDQELIEVLCRARETDWEWSDYRANKALRVMTDEFVDYDKGAPFDEYGEFLWKKKNYPEIPSEHMLSAKAWRLMSLSKILGNIFSQKGAEADKYRQSLFSAIDDYQLAAKVMLLDTYRRVGRQYKYGSADYISIENKRQIIQKAGSSGYDYMYMPDSPVKLKGIWPFLGARNSDSWDEFRGEMDCLTDEDLVKKVIVVQELKRLISERIEPGLMNGQNEKPMGDQSEGSAVDEKDEELLAEARCLKFIEKCHKAETLENIKFYKPAKGGRKPKGIKSQKDYVSELYEQFKKESSVLVSQTVFEQAFKAYKRSLTEKKE